jgi:hypothetical protein
VFVPGRKTYFNGAGRAEPFQLFHAHEMTLAAYAAPFETHRPLCIQRNGTIGLMSLRGMRRERQIERGRERERERAGQGRAFRFPATFA